MTNKTPLYSQHVVMGGKMVDFAGWEMPINYGSQIEEHHQVRRDAGMFDVSHMAVVDLEGARTREFLRFLVANNVDRLQRPGKALYTCMLNEQGGVIDDLIIYFLKENWFRIVVNAGTRQKDLAWIQQHAAPYAVTVKERTDLSMIAVQGPNGRAKTHQALDAAARALAEPLSPFNAVQTQNVFIARTGYTGEDGYELMLPSEAAPALWEALSNAGVKPIGLGARDTLRLEAGLNLYGSDMDETISPLEAGLEWTVAWEPAERNFIGRAALEDQRKNPNTRKLVGLVLNEKGIFRNHQKVMVEGRPAGEITSGSFAPTLGRAIAFARVPGNVSGSCLVELRGKLVTAKVVEPPFVRNGKPCITVDSNNLM